MPGAFIFYTSYFSHNLEMKTRIITYSFASTTTQQTVQITTQQIVQITTQEAVQIIEQQTHNTQDQANT